MNYYEARNSAINRKVGVGLQSPDTFNELDGGINTNTGSARINQSIHQILNTIPGERFFLPEFGSRLHQLVFEPNDLILFDMIELYVTEDLNRWEPRIVVREVSCNVPEHDGNTVEVSITYQINGTNVIDNYVFPFDREIQTMESYTGRRDT